MNNQEVISKIQKLLALAGNNPNEHEARAAAEKAQALLCSHNLSMQQLREAGQETGEEYVKTAGYQGRIRTVEQKYILGLIQRFFFVNVVKQRDTRGGPITIWWLGTTTNVQVAQYVHDFLCLKFKELWKEYKRANRLGEDAKQSYYYGLMVGLREQLNAKQEAVQTERALVLARDPKLDEFMSKAFKQIIYRRATRARVRDTQAMQAGAEQGRKLRINRGVEHKGTGPVLKLGNG